MISIKSSLDREDISFYTLLVQASDQGTPPLTETVSVNVTIEDINDNPPVFSDSNFTVTVAENLPVGTRFLNITALDSDIGDNALLAWSIVSGNVGDVMAIDSSSGRLYNVGELSMTIVKTFPTDRGKFISRSASVLLYNTLRLALKSRTTFFNQSIQKRKVSKETVMLRLCGVLQDNLVSSTEFFYKNLLP